MNTISTLIRGVTAALALAATAQAATAGTYVYVRKVPGFQGPALPWENASSPENGGTGNQPEQPNDPGTPATLSLTTSSLGFGHVPVHALSTLTVDAVNSGTKPLTITSAAVSGTSFTSTSNCVGPLVGGASCRVTVVFAPSTRGPTTGALLVQSSAGSQSASLLGSAYTGTLQMPSYTFPVPVQVASPLIWQDLSVFNPSSAPVTITGASVVTAADSFSQENLCAGSLAPGASCTVRVGFAPTTGGHHEGVVALTSDSEDSPHFIALSGEATAPLLALATGASNRDLGVVAIGGTAGSQIIVRNTGAVPATLRVAVSGDFSVGSSVNACTDGYLLAVNATCRVTTTALVQEERTYNGTVTVSAGNSSVTVTQTVRGDQPGNFSVTESTYTFPTIAAGAATDVHRFVVTHTGGAGITLMQTFEDTGDYASAIASKDGFQIMGTSTCANLQSGESCFLDVRWNSAGFSGSGNLTRLLTVFVANRGETKKTISLTASYDSP